MSSTDFWESDPQLYWAYRTFYLKKNEEEVEITKYNAWLNGNMQNLGTKIAIQQTFGNNQQIKFPDFKETFEKNDKEETLSPEEQFNYWARR